MIQIKNITKKFKNNIILNDSSFNFPNKGIVFILGPSGCGKSTLLNILAGFDTDYSGTIISCNKNISKLNSEELCLYRRENIGFIFQDYHLLKGYTVSENILLNCGEEQIQASQGNLLLNVLKKLDIEDKKNQKVENLSGGQKQRVAIARVLMKNPKIIFADEPTGALDRENSTKIMDILEDISKEKLVIIVTHDKKLCENAENIIEIKNQKVVYVNYSENKNHEPSRDIKVNKEEIIKNTQRINKKHLFKLAVKNGKVHCKMFLFISLAITISMLSFMMSLSINSINDKNTKEFIDKNTAFNNGYIKINESKDIDSYDFLKKDDRIENIYYQYVINDVSISYNGINEKIKEKYPMPKTENSLSYGVLPRNTKNEIAFSPSFAKKLKTNINELISEQVVLKYNNKEYSLTISGIFNADYDDFFISSDIEQNFYDNVSKEPYSISYDVKEFNEIVSVSQDLKENNIATVNASTEVASFIKTFDNIKTLFLFVLILILSICLFITIFLFIKLQNSRFKEIGLFFALGFNKKMVKYILMAENILLSILSIVMFTFFVLIFNIIKNYLDLQIVVNNFEIIILAVVCGLIVCLISIVSSNKLISTNPSLALKK